MKAIMISIKPQYVEKILNGEKTIEIRKTKPKCELPCKVYIYCTKPKKWWAFSNWGATSDELVWKIKDKVKMCNGLEVWDDDCEKLNGKVVAEFTLNKVDTLERDLNDWLPKNRYDISNDLLKDINLNQNELWNYGQGKILYAWHIDNLKIYDKPKELDEFYGAKECPYKDWGDVNNIGCWEYCCEMFSRGECRFGHLKLERPPQSWCYVEELENE